MFNIQGSELIFLLLIALLVLGPEKLPDAVRKFGRAYAEFKKMANGFQGELKTALDDPMKELRETAEAMRQAVKFDINEPTRVDAGAVSEATVEPAPIVREPGLNFGSANPRPEDAQPTPEPAPIVREPGINFGSANPETQQAAAEPAESGLNFGNFRPRSTPIEDIAE